MPWSCLNPSNLAFSHSFSKKSYLIHVYSWLSKIKIQLCQAKPLSSTLEHCLVSSSFSSLLMNYNFLRLFSSLTFMIWHPVIGETCALSKQSGKDSSPLLSSGIESGLPSVYGSDQLQKPNYPDSWKDRTLTSTNVAGALIWMTWTGFCFWAHLFTADMPIFAFDWMQLSFGCQLLALNHHFHQRLKRAFTINYVCATLSAPFFSCCLCLNAPWSAHRSDIQASFRCSSSTFDKASFLCTKT